LEKIEVRTQARKSGDYALADKIREELFKNGIVIEDKQNKTEWKYK
jgi:cysteinyl-tRNA synthetase